VSCGEITQDMNTIPSFNFQCLSSVLNMCNTSLFGNDYYSNLLPAHSSLNHVAVAVQDNTECEKYFDGCVNLVTEFHEMDAHHINMELSNFENGCGYDSVGLSHKLADDPDVQQNETIDENDQAQSESRPFNVTGPSQVEASDADQNSLPATKCSRKRQIRTSLWKKNRTKLARQCGQSYVNNRGIVVPKKQAACAENLCSL